MDTRQPTSASPASTEPTAAAPDALRRADDAMPDVVIVETVTVVSTGLPPSATGDAGTEASASDAAPLQPEDVHVRPPDHLPEGSPAPEVENVELIFERS